MRPVDLAYRLALGAVRVAAPLGAHLPGKLGRGLAGRRRAHLRIAAWAGVHRDRARPAVWVHAPSVGEGLQARAALGALRERRPDAQTLFTHFSPSAEGLARRMEADVADYLPWDLGGPVGTALSAVDPGVVAFTKTEVWPVLSERAAARGAAVALIGATLPVGAGRRRPLARSFLRPTWGRLRLAAAIAEEDAAGLVELGVPAEAVHVTGDPGIDSAAARAREADPGARYLAPFRADPRPTLVAGSTWPADDAVLLPALDRVRERVPDVRAILAPHEPHAAVVAGLLAGLRERGWKAASLGAIEEEGAAGVDAVVVDRVGVLAHLYTVGTVAYVGGGFHGHGLHSVLEPAAARMPVAFGPARGNSRAAADLLACGGARVAKDVEALAEILGEWLMEVPGEAWAGTRAFGYIQRHLGAAARTAALLDELLGRPP